MLRVAHTYLGVDRAALHIVAASKGLVAGMIRFGLPGDDGTPAGGPARLPSSLIPQTAQSCELTSTAAFCLVVEKEAVGEHGAQMPAINALKTWRRVPARCTPPCVCWRDATRQSGVRHGDRGDRVPACAGV